MDIELPYLAEYARTGRATCKGCKSTISKDTLRIAVMVQVSYYVVHTYVSSLQIKD